MLLPTLDSREMLASATAALQTQPCLFPYASVQGDYTIKYTINIRLQASTCPLLSRDFPSWLFLSSDSSTEMSSVDDTAYLLNLRGTDSTALLDVTSDYFGGGDQEEEALGMFKKRNELSIVIKKH